MGKLSSKLKSLSLELVKATPLGDYLADDEGAKEKMDAKYASEVCLLLWLKRLHCVTFEPSRFCATAVTKEAACF